MTQTDVRLAFDLGTTTLAGYLVAADGTVLAEARLPNPQRDFGSDVIRRLESALAGEGERLQRLLLDGMETLIDNLLRQTGCRRADVSAAAAAANSAICHLLRRLPVAPLLFPPHRPRHPEAVLLAASELPLDLPVPLFLFPLVSGYVGGDLVAFLFGCPAPAVTTLYIDVGTNAEMALCSADRWWVTSVPAGPAFEGGEIACGMAALPEAVCRVSLEGDSLRLETVGGRSPAGVCGSGLVEVVAAALAGGLIDLHGAIVDPARVTTNLSRYIVETATGRALRLYRDARVDLLLTQQDVRNFQLAKGAVRAGVDCLLQRAGLVAAQVAEVVMTGAFGFSLAPQTLKKVAMLPESMVEKVRFMPAGALAGVVRLLSEPEAIASLDALVGALTPYPLSGTPAFEKAFLQAIDF